jgi:hypothetical protein
VQSLLWAVTYADSQFVAVGDTGAIVTSTDGITWTKRTSGTLNTLWFVGYGGHLFVAGGVSGTILTSPDGSTWTKRYSGTTSDLFSMVFDNNQFCAMGANGMILTSPVDIPVEIFHHNHANSSSNFNIKTTSGRITAIMPDANSHTKLKVRLLNVAGKQIRSVIVKANNGILNIPVDGISTGVYLLEITDEKNIKISSNISLTR